MKACVRVCMRTYVLFEKSRNADDKVWKEKESVMSLCLDFTQHPLYIQLHITISIIFSHKYDQLMNQESKAYLLQSLTKIWTYFGIRENYGLKWLRAHDLGLLALFSINLIIYFWLAIFFSYAMYCSFPIVSLSFFNVFIIWFKLIN